MCGEVPQGPVAGVWAAFPETHILVDLLQLILPVAPRLAVLRSELLVLEDYAVRFRYPGMSSTPGQAAAAMRALRKVRRALRSRLGL